MEQEMTSTTVSPEAARYKVFTTEFDDVVHVSDLVSEGRLAEILREVSRWRERGDSRIIDYPSVLAETRDRIAAQFEESDIDPSDTSVTLLVDNSGSTRGAPSFHTAIAVMDVCAALEDMGVETTVLGYTTSSWKGGEARKKWLEAGKPRNPGRLCDLLHIVYKHADESVSENPDWLAAIACGETKKENVDGEAYEWAASTTEDTTRRHRILVGISDGFPIDDATIWANEDGMTLMRSHLAEVVRSIDEQGKLALSTVCLDARPTKDTEHGRMMLERRKTYPREVTTEFTGSHETETRALGEGLAVGIARAAEIAPAHECSLRR